MRLLSVYNDNELTWMNSRKYAGTEQMKLAWQSWPIPKKAARVVAATVGSNHCLAFASEHALAVFWVIRGNWVFVHAGNMP
jgi:hypothetical protein